MSFWSTVGAVIIGNVGSLIVMFGAVFFHDLLMSSPPKLSPHERFDEDCEEPHI